MDYFIKEHECAQILIILRQQKDIYIVHEQALRIFTEAICQDQTVNGVCFLLIMVAGDLYRS